MSQRPIDRSADLKRLRDDGYDVEVRGGHLLLKGVPYVTERQEVKRGIIVSVLDLSADGIAIRPGSHVAMFAGDYPCHRDGRRLTEMVINSDRKDLGDGILVQHTFSSKPARGHYVDYFEKLTTYAAILAAPARAIDPTATAKTFPVIEERTEESVFEYVDTASSRAGISAVAQKLSGRKIAIVGLGGTGSYVLDQVAKTPVREIHIFDTDKFSPHNAFRAPGAASIADLRAEPKKVDYFHSVYSRMHRHVVPHDAFIDGSNVDALQGMDFVFVCVDKGPAKRAIVAELEGMKISFIDVGMGIYVKNAALYGVLRVTTSTPTARNHVHERARIDFSDRGVDEEYASNIQVADLNALNAVLAVVKWKKLCGFYGDFDHEHFCAYTVDGNIISNDDRQ